MARPHLSPDGASLYVANGGSNSVSVLDTRTHRVTATVAVGPPGTDPSQRGRHSAKGAAAYCQGGREAQPGYSA
ncbi:hypothetical protein [Streptomyces silvisoli]|uniref:YncE family protein n=1 Tax=Streptomyces silvisoli TaxID=3034235 RepID=A0ABT5ZE61_9ACTN|nr:hypothetical protein [Streptomyces silvisoli]MDF3287966.1 hypothetical protein [Streptomyces silvisoli]